MRGITRCVNRSETSASVNSSFSTEAFSAFSITGSGAATGAAFVGAALVVEPIGRSNGAGADTGALRGTPYSSFSTRSASA